MHNPYLCTLDGWGDTFDVRFVICQVYGRFSDHSSIAENGNELSETQRDKFVMRELDNADVGLREDCEEDLVDVGCNADIYVANQESTDDSIHEVQPCGGCSVRF